MGRVYGASVGVSHDDQRHPRLGVRHHGAEQGGEAGSLNRILNNTTANIIDIGMIEQNPGMPDQQVTRNIESIFCIERSIRKSLREWQSTTRG